MMENEDSEMVAVDLPEEVIRKILLRLPVKSLLKFRCVSKTWLSLTSTRQFAMAYLKVSSKKNGKLIFGSTLSVKNLYTCSVSELTTDLVYSVDHENPVVDYVELDCPFTGIAEYRWIVGSCNGLVCLSFKGNEIILWNPALKKFKKLPYSGTYFKGYGRVISYGFGYDKVHDDYKVVEFSDPQVKVYSRRSNSWKVLGNWPGGGASSCFGKFLNGAIHWSVWNQDWFIVAQDVVSDEFVKLPIPTLEEDSDILIEVKVEILDGCVALCCGYSCYMDVWVMKEYGVGESWIKQLCLPFFQDLDQYHLHPFQPRPLLFFGDGRILINFGTTLRIFDSTNQRPRQISNFDIEEVTITTYLESFVSPSLDEANFF